MAKARILLQGLKGWLGSWFELGAILFLFLVLEIAVRSIEQAQWIKPQPSLTVILMLAMLTGWLLYRSHLPNKASYPVAVFLGALVTVWQASNLLPPSETASRLSQLVVALRSWWQAMSMARPSEGTIHFAVFLIFFTWIIGYISTWFILRRQNAWVAVSLGVVTILVNLSNLTQEYYVFFFFYLLAGMLLVGWMSLGRHYSWFREYGIHYPKRGLMHFTASLLCLSLLVASLALLTPEILVNRLDTVAVTKMPWRNNIEEYLTNTLAAVPAKQPSLRSREQKGLLFRDFSQSGNEVHFILTSERPFYLRTRIYDVYISQGWKNSDAVEYVSGQETTGAVTEGFSERSEMTYTVLTGLRTDVVLTAGEFVSSDVFGVTRMQMGVGDTISVITPYVLRPGQRYTVTASVSSATSAELSKAGEDYPQQVTDYYLQLSPTLPERVVQLSQTVTQEAESPYDKAIAIKNYLALMRYTPKIKASPEEVDGVDSFLFTQKLGNCAHFASAMVVMLRSVGVPSRLCVGYLPGKWDATAGSSTIRAKDYHAWPAVYFPGYGWVEFEAVPVASSESEGAFSPASGSDLFFGGEWEDWMAYEEMWTSGAVTNGNQDSSSTVTSSRNWSLLWSLLLAIIGAIILFYALRFVASRWLTRFGGPDYASSIYGRVCFLASLVKLGPQPQQTPFEYGARLVAVFPLQAEALDIIVRTYIENRFSPRKELGILQKGMLQKSWCQLYPTLLKRLFHV